jgi:uncharacterized membrane protein YgcG
MERLTLSDRDVELLLSEATPPSEAAAQLVVFVDLIRAEGARAPSDAMVAMVASEAAEIARSTAPRKPAADPQQRRLAAWRPRPQVAVAAATVLLLMSVSGVAVAANGAAPGDALYGIDRALEKIGIGAGHAEERLDEARSLLSDGEAREALRHASEVLDEEDKSEGTAVQDARTALEDAALNLEDDGATSNEVVRDSVSDLLRYLQENVGNHVGADGREFGQGVADLARDIAPGQGDRSNQGDGNGNGNGGSNGGNGNGNGGSNGGNGAPDG